jgi:CarD family transcriptional regulator
MKEVQQMYNVGDIILYGSNGVCSITEITTKNIGGADMEYYVLKPVCTKSSTLFVPTGNEQLIAKMRYVLSSDEINEVISNIEEKPDWIKDKNERFTFCKDVIASGNFEKLVNLIRSLRFHEKYQMKRGKHLHISDERFLKEAEKMVCDEMSLVLNIERSAVIPMLLNA